MGLSVNGVVRARSDSKMAPPTEMSVGLHKGHKTAKNVQKPRVVRRKGHLNKRVKFIRDVVKEVVGFAPYEKRAMELLKVQKGKRALKFIKKGLELIAGGRRSVTTLLPSWL